MTKVNKLNKKRHPKRKINVERMKQSTLGKIELNTGVRERVSEKRERGDS